MVPGKGTGPGEVGDQHFNLLCRLRNEMLGTAEICVRPLREGMFVATFQKRSLRQRWPGQGRATTGWDRR